MDWSAIRTGSESASAWECAMTVRTPSSRQVRMIRSAISPRLAIRILPNTSAAQDSPPLRLDLALAQAVHERDRFCNRPTPAELTDERADGRHAATVDEVPHDPEGDVVAG